MVYMAIATSVGFFLGTYIDYRRWKRYLDSLDALLTDLDKKYLFPEMIEQGENQEEKKLQDIFYDMEVSMNEQVSNYRRNMEEYKEYVETWVHEIKIPIGAMKMILTNHKEADYGLSDEVSRVEGYVEQALFYARSNAVEKDYLINRIELLQVVQDAVLKRKKTLRDMHAGIDLHDLEIEIYSDSKWLAFMLGQVLDNSIKYRKKDALSIEIYSEKRDNAVLLHIKDNGAGIKESELSRVFDKGFTGSNGRRGSDSTGIGLYLCKKLCKRLEHNITIESEVGKGTTVTFVFPVSSMITMEWISNNLTTL